jgi:hypothetical protein
MITNHTQQDPKRIHLEPPRRRSNNHQNEFNLLQFQKYKTKLQ